MQQRVGLKVVTDGEYRCTAYHDFFFEHLGDVTIGWPPVDAADARGGAKRAAQPIAIVKSALRWTAPTHEGEMGFLKQHSQAMPKITLPGPCTLHFRGAAPEILRHGAYTDIQASWSDIVDSYAGELEAIAAAAGLHIGMHLCRGNRGGHFHAEGGYDVIAEKLFNALDFPFYFLEYDSPRAGDFSPLRHLPADKSVVLGMVSTKSEDFQTKDDLKRRIDAAAEI